MIVLSLTEEDRSLLLPLTPEQRDQVFLALLTGAGAGSSWGKMEKETLEAIRRRAARRKQKSEYSKRYYRGHVQNAVQNVVQNTVQNGHPHSPSSPSSAPFLPPSSLPPEPPLSTPPYNPPSSPSLSPSPRDVSRADEDRFSRFWAAYPRKVGKQAAKKSWSRLHPSEELTQAILQAVEAQKQSRQWRENNGQFIPNPATWLNQGRWEDELPKGESSNPFLDMLEEAGL
jgi:hypothetical protein|nr:MAG TPA: replisome organizer protein [Caudoviricetes sp.]